MTASTESRSPEGQLLDPAPRRIVYVSSDGSALDEVTETLPGAEAAFDSWVQAQLAQAAVGADSATASGLVAVVYPSAEPSEARLEFDHRVQLLDPAALVLSAAGLSTSGEDRRVFTGDTTPTSLRALRDWAVEQTAGLGFSTSDLALIISELATNVERYAPGWLTVDLIRTQGTLLVAVTDRASDRLPHRRDPEPEELTGRGLLVVASLSAIWGFVVRPSNKTVWSAFDM